MHFVRVERHGKRLYHGRQACKPWLVAGGCVLTVSKHHKHALRWLQHERHNCGFAIFPTRFETADAAHDGMPQLRAIADGTEFGRDLADCIVEVGHEIYVAPVSHTPVAVFQIFVVAQVAVGSAKKPCQFVRFNAFHHRCPGLTQRLNPGRDRVGQCGIVGQYQQTIGCP